MKTITRNITAIRNLFRMSTTFRMSTKNVMAPEIVVNNDRISKKVFTFHNCIIFPRKKIYMSKI